MRIVVTGGGSGGHITPLLAVASELKKLNPDAEIVYIGQRGDPFVEVVAENASIISKVYRIHAGKFRRYHGEGFSQLRDIKTVLLNIRDAFRIVMGIIESTWIIGRLRPNVVFIKGGFIGVPVGLAAAIWREPYVTHDSDALAGLANRIIARWARIHAVALPKEQYSYPQDKTVTVGVPIAAEYSTVNAKAQLAYKQRLNIPADAQVVCVTGGGLGSQIINESIITIAPDLLHKHPKLYVIHNTGRAHAESVLKAYEKNILPEARSRIIVKDYIQDLYNYSGAADIVIARAGATTLAELATQGKACIIIPSPVLAGGHQLKNAYAFEQAGAVKVVDEADLRQNLARLFNTIEQMLDSTQERNLLRKNLHTFAYPDSAKLLAQIVLEAAQ